MAHQNIYTGAVDSPGELKLNVYGYDMFDNDNMNYYWTIATSNRSYTKTQLNGGISNYVTFRVNSTAQYQGEVKLESDNKSAVTRFIIYSLLDTNGNAISDEFEERLLETNETLSSYSDADDDGFTDLYELYVLGTNYTNPDTDGDGAWDPFDRDPLRDVMLEISPISASKSSSSTLQILISL